MIIQCEQCQTKFRLDDSKVAVKSIRVRCAKCKHVFSVASPQAMEEESVSVWQDTPALTTESAQEYAIQDSGPESAQQEAASDLMDTISFDNDEQSAPASTAPAPEAGDAGFAFPSVDATAQEQARTEEASEEMDFGAFDFGEESGDSAEPAATPPKPTQVKKASGGLDFSGDDMFGEVVSAKSEEEAAEAISFDMGMEGFAASMGVESQGTGQGASLAPQDLAAENPFSLDDIDFGDELTSVAVQQVSPEELKPSQELLFTPLAATETQPMFEQASPAPVKPAAVVQEDLPPLSIASRRKESPRISGMLLFMGVIIAGLVVFYSYWGYKMLTETKTVISEETGRIALRSVEATFVKNKKTGDLLVISGEAVNEYNKPRAAIQVKGIVFGADGEEVSSKIAFCGNPLTEEQLASMSMEKIEAAMANQFGDSLANMEVAPGSSIPFVIVIPKPPKGATDYGVEPAGSTVATVGKEEK